MQCEICLLSAAAKRSPVTQQVCQSSQEMRDKYETETMTTVHQFELDVTSAAGRLKGQFTQITRNEASVEKKLCCFLQWHESEKVKVADEFTDVIMMFL